MALIKSVFGSRIGEFFDRPYWAVKLRDGKWLSEVDGRVNFMSASILPYDWTLDLVTTGDVRKIEELWMFCPKTQCNPNGNTARLVIKPDEAGTAFHFNVTRMNAELRRNHKIIGKVTNRETLDCLCFIWDDELRVLSAPFQNNLNYFKSWRPGVADIGMMHAEVIGYLAR